MGTSWVVYTDGSFGNDSMCHGGVIFLNKNEYMGVHVTCTKREFVEMRNVGGEILAAWAAINSIANMVKKLNEDQMDTYELHLVYDYKGVGEWLTGGWKTNKLATKWFAQSVNAILKEVPNLKVNYVWVKGHEDTYGNILADKVAGYDMSYVTRNNITVYDLDTVVNI